jgi:hypothetical protein
VWQAKKFLTAPAVMEPRKTIVTQTSGPRPVIYRPPGVGSQGVSHPPRSPPPSASPRSPRHPSLLNDPELTELRNRLYENEDLNKIDDQQLSRLWSHLREFSFSLAMSEDYDEARRASDLMLSVRQELQNREPPSPTSTPRDLETSSDNLERDWSERFSNYDNETAARRTQLLTNNANSLDRFERLWQGKMPRLYRKPSGRYLQLKQQEWALAVVRDFDRASMLHRECEVLRAEEANAAQAQLVSDYREARGRLLAKQQQDLDQYDASRERSRACMVAKYQRACDVLALTQTVARTRQARRTQQASSIELGVSIEASVQSKTRPRDPLLPPLMPPNDPQFVQDEQRRRDEVRRHAIEYSRWNAERTLAKYNGQPIAPQPRQTGQQRQQSQRATEQLGPEVMEPFATAVMEVMDHPPEQDAQDDAEQQEKVTTLGDVMGEELKRAEGEEEEKAVAPLNATREELRTAEEDG